MATYPNISGFIGKRVLILGDLILDRYLHVHSHRSSAEAPIPVYEVENTTTHPGGAGNVLNNIAAMGGTPFLVALGGNDCWQSVLKDLLPAQQYSLLPSDRISTLKTRLVEGDQQVACFEEQDTRDMEDAAFLALQAFLPDLLLDFRPDVVILQDYDRGFFTKKNIPFILETCASHPVPVVVDPKYKNFGCYQKVALFKPNLAELRQGLGRIISPEETNDSILASLNEVISATQFLITLSEHGILYGNAQAHGRLPSLVKSMRDVSGAGDTVISAAALGLACGWPLSDIAYIANVAAAVACENPGVYPVSADEISKRLVLAPGNTSST